MNGHYSYGANSTDSRNPAYRSGFWMGVLTAASIGVSAWTIGSYFANDRKIRASNLEAACAAPASYIPQIQIDIAGYRGILKSYFDCSRSSISSNKK